MFSVRIYWYVEESVIQGKKIPIMGSIWPTQTYFHFALCSTCELCDNNMCVTKTKQEILHIHTEHRRSAFFPILI